MSDKQETIRAILGEMRAIFRPAYGTDRENEKMALGAYVRVMRQFDAHVLERGWTSLLLEHTGPQWPSPALMFKHFANAKPRPEPAAEITEREVFESGAGVYALKNGFGYDLWLWSKENNRIPDQNELNEIARKINISPPASEFSACNQLIASLTTTRELRERRLREKYLPGKINGTSTST